MRKYFLILSLIFLSLSSFAHQPDISSTLLVAQEDGRWILVIRSSLTAFEQEVHQHYGQDSYATPEEFQQLVIEHLTKHIRIQGDQNEASVLENGYVQLGHETKVMFEIIGLPKQLNALLIKNSSFKCIHHNQSVLSIMKDEFKTNRFILENANQHTAELMLVDNTVALQSK